MIPPAIAAGTTVRPGGAGPLRTPVAQQDPVDHDRQQVDAVEQDEEGQHPVRRLAPRHPGLAKRPVGEHDAARAASREEPGRGEPGEGDLVGLAPVQPGALADDPAEEGDVGEEHQDREDEPDADPDRVRLAELLDRVLEADEVRQQDVDRDDEDEDERERLEQALRVGEERRLLVVALVVLVVAVLARGRLEVVDRGRGDVQPAPRPFSC